MSDPLPPDENPYAGPPLGVTPITPPIEPGPRPGTGRALLPTDRDPGSSRALEWAWIAVALLLPVIVALNQMAANFAPTQIDRTDEIAPPSSVDSFTLTSKLVLKLTHFLDEAGFDGDELMGKLQETLPDSAYSDADKVRLAIAQWELDKPDEAQTTLDNLSADLEHEPDAAILPDIQIVTDLLAGQPPATTEERDAFVERHGWLAELALSHDDKSIHDDLLKGGLRMIVTFSIIALIFVSAIIAGLVLLIIGLFCVSSGKMPRRFEPPNPGGSVYLEMLPVFIISFLALQVVAGILLVALGGTYGLVASLGAQWLLLGVIAWPVVRGVPWSRVRQDLGLVAPNGVFREIRAGVLFYIAALPIYFFVAAVVLVLFMILEFVKSEMSEGAPPAPPPSNGPMDLIGSGSPLVIIMFFLLATVWAPLVEEIIFRGGVYRHLRSKIHWVPSALIVAVFFGMMHNYHPLQLIPVMALGFIFAVMREWRGSIVASMTAHFIHNFVMLIVMLVILGYALR